MNTGSLKVSRSTAELWAQKADAVRDISANSGPAELPERDWNIRLGETESPVNIPITQTANRQRACPLERIIGRAFDSYLADL